MRNLDALLRALRNEGIHLWVEDGQLHYRSRAGRLPAQTAEQIRARRDEIVDLLANQPRSTPAEFVNEWQTPYEGGTSCLQAHMLAYYDQLKRPEFLHPSCTWSWAGPIDLNILQQSLNVLISRHAALRCRFPASDGANHRMIVDDSVAITIESHDLRALPDPTQDMEARRTTHGIIGRQFDVRTGPLLRVAVVNLRPCLSVLVLVFHHAIMDGMSLAIFFNELMASYTCLRSGSRQPLRRLPIDLMEVMRDKCEWLTSAAAAKQAAYWRETFKDADNPFWLPHDRSCADHPEPADAGPLAVSLSQSTTCAVAAICHQEHITLVVALLTAFALAIAQWTKCPEVCMWVLNHGRHKAEYYGLIGCFIDTWVLRTNLARAPDFRESLRSVAAAYAKAQPNIQIPSQIVARTLESERGAPLERATLFNYVGAGTFQPAGKRADVGTGHIAEPEFQITPLNWSPQQGHLETSNGTQLIITIGEHVDTVSWTLQFDPAVFERATVSTLSETALRLLESAAAQSGGPIAAPAGSGASSR